MPIVKQSFSVVDIVLAVLVGVFGMAVALMTLRRGVWLDEFITIARTTSDTSPREFLTQMIARESHPLLHFGMVYLLQAVGMNDVALLRSLNLLGLPLVIFAVAYGIRHKSINLSQALIVWVLFSSSPIFFAYFAELRCYFLLYAASIATSVVWYVQMRHIETGQKVSGTMILIWAACLAIFVNLHYFATILGGMLTAALLVRLAISRLWSQVLVIGSISLAVAAPALIVGALQAFSTQYPNMAWIKTSPIDSIKTSVRMLEGAAARNLAAVASAVVMCLFILEDRRKWSELRTAVILLSVVALFLVMLVMANAIKPLIVDRYLIAGAGSVTFAVAILAASSGAPAWLPVAASAIALLLQAQTLRSNLGIDQHGWLPSARAVAQLKSECPTTKIFAYLNPTNGLNDIATNVKFNSVSYGYYARKFHFSYEDLRPGATIVASGPCPSVIWIEHLPMFFFDANPNADIEEVLSEFKISKIGVAEMKRYGSGLVIIVHE